MTITSPDVFRARPGRGTGVRRLNRRPLLIALGLGGIVVSAIAYTAYDRAQTVNRESRSIEFAPAVSADAGRVLVNAPEAGVIEAKQPPAPPDLPIDPLPLPAAARMPPLDIPSDGLPPSDAADAHARAWEEYRQRQARIDEAKAQAALSALSAPTSVALPSRADGPAESRSPPPAAPMMHLPDLSQLAAAATGQGAGGSQDPNRGAEKVAWLKTTPDPTTYLPSTRTGPLSPFELKAGAVIPGVMISGINSDLPGQILGQVREDVWDTATGRFLLMPRGSRLVGTYDSQVTRGQSRLLIAWTRVIYPDGSVLELGHMPGTDQAGYAGVADKVNNHTFAVFRDAALLSLLAAGGQLSQPQGDPAQGFDTQQILAASVGQQFAQTGSQIVSRNLSIQPTLEIRPGLRFNIAVTKDIVVTPWMPRKPG